MKIALKLLFPVVALLAGCAGYLPGSGPGRTRIVTGASLTSQDLGANRVVRYALVNLNTSGLPQTTSLDRRPVFDVPVATIADTGGAIGTSDDIGITIFEAAAGGLFIPAEPGTHAGNFVTLPTQQVDRNGNMTVPFAGTVHVAGMTPLEVQKTIEGRLANRALEPQVVVTVLNRRANAINVIGDVANAARFTLEPGGEHLLGAISRAGGPRFPTYETTVTLQRDGALHKAMLSEIVARPDQDIGLRGGDSLIVSHEPRYFTALGATGNSNSLGPINRRFPFEDNQLTLTDALAKSGGLADDRANDRAVFVYRFEDRTVLSALGIEVPTGMPDQIPTIYLVDLSDPSGFFLAGRMAMRGQDLLYVSNAPSTDLAKILALVLPSAYAASNFSALR